MKSVVALFIVGVTAWIGWSLSDPVFDAAARNLCQAHGDENGLELVDASGRLGYRRFSGFFEVRTPAYSCEFEEADGDVVLLDEADGVMRVTWESRAIRVGGWLLTFMPIVGGMAIVGKLGLLKRD